MVNKKHLLCIVLLCSLILYSSCNNAQDQHKKANRLIHESSPYLLQHAYNPVDWYPWGDKAFERAKKENKPVIVSIGYSSCHWCHVMEKESFEDDSVAQFMNEHFISIKVDREERPDIDQIYIEVAQMINGSAGWPLNCMVLPDGKPFFAGTYYPKEQWLTLLQKVTELWEKDRKVITDQADQITAGIKGNAIFQQSEARDIDSEFTKTISAAWLRMFDTKEGGYNRVPKFPMPANHEALLTLSTLKNNQDALDIVNITLQKMAQGGIYDQVGGGFARYSTDGYWKVPHFEKMLYDNGQLLSLYSKAFQITKNPMYKQVVEETIEFLSRELRSEYGGFYSSLDADSDGEEGLFYVWEKAELDNILGNNAPIIEAYYQVTEKGNWEHGKNILLVTEDASKVLERYQVTADSLHRMVMESKAKLLAKRAEKIRPGLDDKILTSWNALTIIGLADAYRTFQHEEYLNLALEGMQFLSEKMTGEDFRMERNFKDGKSSINAFLDDYAFTIAAMIHVYQITFDEQWLFKAKSLCDYVLTHFSDSASNYFFYTSDVDPPLITRKIDNRDNVIPSANSEMAINLFLLGNYFYDEDYLNKSHNMLQGMTGYIKDRIGSYVNWFHLYMLSSGDFYEIAIVGEHYATLKSEMEQTYLPNVILMGGQDEGSLELLQHKLIDGQTQIYVCKDKLCKLPVREVHAALLQMH